jgi:acyl-CoA synthetase (NDP forming)/RimJ/RimL family protein N-acetyltransferase
MAEYPSEFEFDAMLTDGTVVHVRPIRPSDAELEHQFILRVGPRSMYQRFFLAKKDLTPEELRYFTTVDYEDRMALIVLDGERMVAVGRYDVVEEPETQGRTAEVAFLVEDEYQGRGIGSTLLQHLTTYARLQGVTGFNAFVLADNFGMMRLFRSSGYRVQRALEEDVYRVEFPIEYSPEARAADSEYERRAVAASVTPLFFPRRVAVIGADQPVDSVGGIVQENLMLGGYTGIVYPVNPTRTFVRSVKSYPTVEDVPDDIDLAYVSVAPDEVLDALVDCGKKGIRAVVVTTTDPSGGGPFESQLVRVARRAGMRLVGPDSSGVVTTNPAVNLHGVTGQTDIRPGRIGLAAQSGPVGLAILSDAAWLSPGISSFVSLGDAADVTANDALIYWEDDPFTEVILLYVESFGNPRRFGRLARRVGHRKPIVAVKGGRTRVGSRTVPSRSGWLEHPELAVEALFHASGVIRAETITEMYDIARLLASQPVPAGRRVAVVARAFGPGSMAVGALESNGLEVPDLPEDLLARIRDESGALGTNPIVAHDPEREAAIVDVLEPGDAVDAIVFVGMPAPRAGSGSVPLLQVEMGALRPTGWSTNDGVPLYGYPEHAARALTAAVRYGEWRKRPEGSLPDYPDVDRVTTRQVVQRAVHGLEGEAGELAPDHVAKVLAAYGIPFDPDAEPDASEHEVFVAMVEDPLFGPLVVYGLSGMLSELAGDVSFRVNPLTDVDADEMLREVKSGRILFGYRGSTPGDVDALRDLVLRVSYLVENIPEIVELELNPIRVGAPGAGCVVTRASIRIREVPGAFVPSRKDIPGRML